MEYIHGRSMGVLQDGPGDVEQGEHEETCNEVQQPYQSFEEIRMYLPDRQAHAGLD